MPLIDIDTVSPDFNQPYRFSFLPSTTPLGVPVKIMSPSCSVIKLGYKFDNRVRFKHHLL